MRTHGDAGGRARAVAPRLAHPPLAHPPVAQAQAVVCRWLAAWPRWALLWLALGPPVQATAAGAAAQGTLGEGSFYSEALGQTRSFRVYLPAGYDPDGRIRYPVMYFLHGLSSAPDDYAGAMFVGLDLLIGLHVVGPMIVVLPDGRAPPYEGSFYTSSTLYGDMERYVVHDLVEYVDGHYATDGRREGRVIAGHSMGGYGAMKLALKNPQVYRGVVSHSGPLDLGRVGQLLPGLLTECEGPPYGFRADAGFFSGAMFAMAGAFSPARMPGGLDVDLPVGPDGQLVQSVLERWRAHDPALLARQLPRRPELAVYFDCGTEDELGLYPWNVSFADSLARLGVPYEFDSYTGGHVDKLAQRLAISVRFVDSIVAPVTLVGPDSADGRPPTFQLEANYPNPFNATTAIPFQLSVSARVRLEVYSALGQRVATLVDGPRPPGRYLVRWGAGELPAGSYLCRLQVGRHRQVRPLLLLR